MVRTFHHHFSLSAKAGMLLLALLAVYCFLMKLAIVGLALVVLEVLAMERVLHSEYVLDKGCLTIYRGRFFRSKTIAVADIHSCRPMTTTFGMVHYLLLCYGHDQLTTVEPSDEASFVAYLQRLKKESVALRQQEPEDGTEA